MVERKGVVFQVSHEVLESKDDAFEVSHDVLESKDVVFQVSHEVLESKDVVFQVSHDMVERKDDVFQSSYDMVERKDDVFQLSHDMVERKGVVFQLSHDLVERNVCVPSPCGTRPPAQICAAVTVSTRAPGQNGASMHRALAATLRSAVEALQLRFEAAPEWIAAAPGRVNLIGEHTDYNDGFVLPMAIERYTVLAAARAEDAVEGPVFHLHSATVSGSVTLALGAPQQASAPRWANYVRGVVAGFQERGAALRSMRASLVSDVPLGGGLSSSAALEVSTATLFEAANGLSLLPLDKARLCQKAEHEFAGVPCGLMDPLASILGEERGPLLIDCRSGAARAISLADRRVSVLVTNTNVRHSLGDGAYAKRRDECERAAGILGVPSLRDATPALVDGAREKLGPVLLRRARHVVTENARTLEAVQAFERGDSAAAGALFYESHRSLRDDYEVSCEELDLLVDAAHALGPAAGVYGARMTGGGFGGCTVTLVRSDEVENVGRVLTRLYREKTGRTADAFVSRPARGAHAIPPALLAGGAGA